MSADAGDIYDLEDLANQPGTYFNPQTEVVLVVDDSASMDQELFDGEAYEGADWVRISEEVPVDEHALSETLEGFQASFHPGSSPSVGVTGLDLEDDDRDPDPEPTLEPDPDPKD